MNGTTPLRVLDRLGVVDGQDKERVPALATVALSPGPVSRAAVGSRPAAAERRGDDVH